MDSPTDSSSSSGSVCSTSSPTLGPIVSKRTRKSYSCDTCKIRKRKVFITSSAPSILRHLTSRFTSSATETIFAVLASSGVKYVLGTVAPFLPGRFKQSRISCHSLIHPTCPGNVDQKKQSSRERLDD
jgi:hypothetical protein